MTGADTPVLPIVDFTVALIGVVSNKNSTLSTDAQVQELLDKGASAGYEWLQDKHGWSALHHACHAGYINAVKMLTAVGHPWNVLNDKGECAAEIAKSAGHLNCYEYLLQEACRSEMLLGAVESKIPKTNEYLESSVEYNKDDSTLVDSDMNAVMMEWERELMRRHALTICQMEDIPFASEYLAKLPHFESGMPSRYQVILDCRTVLDAIMPGYAKLIPVVAQSGAQQFNVLNVGFGLGIIDTYIEQLLALKRLQGFHVCHQIIEAHPLVLSKMKSLGWMNADGSLIVHSGKWQDVVATDEIYAHGLFNGVFFDTFGEDYSALKQFNEHVPNLLDCHSPSVYSFFNGMAGTNGFFHEVYNNVAEMDLNENALNTKWETFPVDSGECRQESNDNHVWNGIQRNYYTLTHYDLPVCTLMDQ